MDNKDDPIESNRVLICLKCGREKKIYAKQMCRDDVSKHPECKKCKELKPIRAKEMCSKCYESERRNSTKADTSKHRECKNCGQVKPIKAREMCSKCYQQEICQVARVNESDQSIPNQNNWLNAILQMCEQLGENTVLNSGNDNAVQEPVYPSLENKDDNLEIKPEMEPCCSSSLKD